VVQVSVRVTVRNLQVPVPVLCMNYGDWVRQHKVKLLFVAYRIKQKPGAHEHLLLAPLVLQ